MSSVADAERGYADITDGVLRKQNVLIPSILAAHVNGYSLIP